MENMKSYPPYRFVILALAAVLMLRESPMILSDASS